MAEIRLLEKTSRIIPIAIAASLLFGGPLTCRAQTSRASTQSQTDKLTGQLQSLQADIENLKRHPSEPQLDLERQKLEQEVAKLRLEVQALQDSSGSLAHVIQWLQAVGLGSLLGGLLVLYAGRSLSHVQKEKIKQDLDFGTEDHLLQKRKLEQELQMKLFEALGSPEPRIRIGAVSELGQRIRELNDQLQAPGLAEVISTRVRRERETIIRVLIAATKHESSEDLQKYIADLIVDVLGARAPNLDKSPLQDYDFQGAGLTNAWWKAVDARQTDFYKAQLSRAGLANSRLAGAIFKNANLSGATLRDASAVGANFEKADLSGAKVDRADFTGARFDGADLRNAIVTGANFTRASLRGAKLQGVDFTSAELTGANLDGIETDAHTTFP